MKKILRFFIITLLTLAIPFKLISQGPEQQSVHDMFKDVPEYELMQMMEEGQRFIDEMQKRGDKDEIEAFEKQMEETLRNFSPEDWQEFQEIVDVVKDKLPEPEPVIEEPVKRDSPTLSQDKDKEKVSKVDTFDTSIEKMLTSIAKLTKGILQKAKSDKMLSEYIDHQWTEKDDFSQMIRLVQILTKKDMLATLTEAKEEDTQKLLESLQNFNKRLKIEDQAFNVADTFGLDVDTKLSEMNLKQLKEIVKFFSEATISLSPKVTKFIEKHDPQALEKAKALDAQSKKAQEDADKALKTKKSGQQFSSSGQAPYSGQQSYNPASNGYYSNPGSYGGYSDYPSTGRRRAAAKNQSSGEKSQSAESKNNENNDFFLNKDKKDKEADKDKSSTGASAEKKSNSNSKSKEEKGLSPYDTAQYSLDTYFHLFTEEDVQQFNNLLTRFVDRYPDFNSNPLATSDDRKLALINEYHDHFLKNNMHELLPHIDEINVSLKIVRENLQAMSDQELNKISQSESLQKMKKRITELKECYEKSFLQEVEKKYTSNRLYLASNDSKNQLDNVHDKIKKLHGLDEKIIETQALSDTLTKSIKAEIVRRRRNKSKANARAQSSTNEQNSSSANNQSNASV